MPAPETRQVGVTAVPARGDADDVPGVRDLARPGWVEPQGAAPDLLDGCRGRDAREVDQRVEALRIPALAEDAARPDEAARDALVECGRRHPSVRARAPVGTVADDLCDARFPGRLEAAGRLETLRGEPRAEPVDEGLAGRRRDPERRARDEDRYESGRDRIVQHASEHAKRATRVPVDDAVDAASIAPTASRSP